MAIIINIFSDVRGSRSKTISDVEKGWVRYMYIIQLDIRPGEQDIRPSE